MKLETELTKIDRELLAEATDGFVPKRVIDFHAHVMHQQFYKPENLNASLVGKTLDFATYAKAMELLLSGRQLAGALIFPYPSRQSDNVGLNRWMFSDLGSASNRKISAGLALVGPREDPGYLAEWFKQGLCVGLKPYHLYAKPGDTTQCTIEEWAPEWMWKLCDQHHGILMLHLVKDAAMSDPSNRETLQRLCTKYPSCRTVVAHVGRAFNHRTARGLSAVAKLPNLIVDMSAITEVESIKIAFGTLGVGRVLFGTDYPISHWRGRCVTAGDSFQWIYGETDKNPGMTLVGIESLRSLREASEQIGLKPAEIDQVFFGNAQTILGFAAN